MAGKTLSNGTLSLRFMQNAQRAKQEKAVELQRAKVKDEAEWEVSRELKEAWGLSTDSGSSSRHSLTHEPSYLPFLFPSLLRAESPSDEDDSENMPSTSFGKVNGRRTFKKGRELVSSPEVVKEETEENTPNIVPKVESRRHTGLGSKLSKPSATKRLARQDEELKNIDKKTVRPDVPVLSMISGEDKSTVGMDIRQLRKTTKLTASQSQAQRTIIKSESHDNPPSQTSGSIGFLRPAGVDGPVATGNTSHASRQAKAPARRLSEKHDREQESSDEANSLNDLNTAVSAEVKEQRGKRRKKKKRYINKEEPEVTGISMQR